MGIGETNIHASKPWEVMRAQYLLSKPSLVEQHLKSQDA